MKRTRLLSVIHGPAFGGAHNQALRLRAPLEARGVETTVVLPDDATEAAERLRAGGVDTVTMPLHRLRASPNPAIQARFAARLPGEVRELRRLIGERGVDVVQVHGATNPHGALAARRTEAAVVWQLFDTRAPMGLRRVAMPLVVRLADAITTWGEELARVHPGTERLGERVITVYPPVDEGEFAADPARRAAARARLEVEGDAPLVATVAVLNPQKGHEHLIRAAALVRGRRADVEFRVLGGSSPAHADYERGLRAEVAARGLDGAFRFVDPGTDVPELVQAIDVFAMTSVPRSEGMPTAILEAMACEKPVVATDVGAIRELVEDGRTGIVVEPEDPEALARIVLALLEDDARRAELAAAGRRRVSERFGLERLADLHAGAYEVALAHRRARRAR